MSQSSPTSFSRRRPSITHANRAELTRVQRGLRFGSLPQAPRILNARNATVAGGYAVAGGPTWSTSWGQTRRSFLGCYAQSLVDDHEVAYVNLVVLVLGQEVKTADFRFLSRALMATS
jgi:hypothetical protein